MRHASLKRTSYSSRGSRYPYPTLSQTPEDMASTSSRLLPPQMRLFTQCELAAIAHWASGGFPSVPLALTAYTPNSVFSRPIAALLASSPFHLPLPESWQQQSIFHDPAPSTIAKYERAPDAEIHIPCSSIV